MDLNYGLQRYLAELGTERRGGGRLLIVSSGATNDTWLQEWIQKYGAPGLGQAGVAFYTSLTAALSASIASRGDTILVLPGTHTQTALLTMSKANVRLTGIPGWERATIINGDTTAGVDCISVTGARCIIEHLTLRSGSATSFAVSLSATSDQTKIRSVHFESTNANGDGLEIAANADGVIIEDCVFDQLDLAVNLVSTGGAGSDDVVLKGCLFRGCTTGLTDAGSAGATHFTRLVVEACKSVGTLGADWLKLDTIAGGTGVITGCLWSHASNAATRFVIPAGVLWVCNGTQAGWSTAAPV